MKKVFEMLLSGLLALWNRIKESTPRTQSTNDQTGKDNTNLTVTGPNSIVIITNKADKDGNDFEVMVEKVDPPPERDPSQSSAKSETKPVSKMKKTVRHKPRHKKPRH